MKHFLCLFAVIAALHTHSATAAAIDAHNADDNSSKLPRLNDQRIVGGTPVHVALYPHQVSLRYKNIFTPTNSFSHRCGGVLYSEKIVITAAHCVIGVVPSQYKVAAGTNNRRGSEGFIVPVTDIIQHEDYNPDTYDNDIAILVLGTPMPINNFTVKPIELVETTPKAGATSIVTGWGTTTQGGVASDLLQEVQVPIVDNETCAKDYKDELISDAMLCAGVRGEGGKDACQGDSGGPLIVDGKLAGIVSWGYGCAQPDYPGVYANVAYLRPWLLKNIAQFN